MTVCAEEEIEPAKEMRVDSNYFWLSRYAPDSAVLPNYRNVLLEQRKLDQAISEYSEAIRLDPSVPSAHDNIGTCFAVKHNLDTAIAE